MLQDFVSIGPNFFFDGLKGLGLRAAVVFHRGADHAAGIGDEIGDDQYPLFVQDSFRLWRKRNVRSLRDEFGFQTSDIVFADDIGAGRRDPDFTFDVDDGVGFEFLAFGIIGYVLPRVLKSNQTLDTNSFGVEDCSMRIGGGNEYGPFLCEKAGSVFAHRTEALNRQCARL